MSAVHPLSREGPEQDAFLAGVEWDRCSFHQEEKVAQVGVLLPPKLDSDPQLSAPGRYVALPDDADICLSHFQAQVSSTISAQKVEKRLRGTVYKARTE